MDYRTELEHEQDGVFVNRFQELENRPQSRGCEACQYRWLSLVDLVECCVHGDVEALRELHDRRTPFSFDGGLRLRMVEFLNELRHCHAKREGGDVADQAYAIAIDKFSKVSIEAEKSGAAGERHQRAIDCRKYFQAYLKEFHARKAAAPNPLEEELLAARLLQGLVDRHYRLSLLECRRNARPAMTRYVWRLPAGSISLQMPRHISGRERREWLERNFGHPNPLSPGLRERIQEKIDEELGGQVYSLDDTVFQGTVAEAEGIGLRGYYDSIGVNGLACAVAEEKVDRICHQRPAIQSLGDKALRSLILRIFSDLDSDEYHEAELAEEFGLSKATFSRFAGSRWDRGARDKAVPDLWHNTAQVLASGEEFEAVARDANVWEVAVGILKQSQSDPRGKKSEE